MRKMVAAYVAEVQDIKPNARNPRNNDVRVLPQGSTFYYTVEAPADAPIVVGDHYIVTLLLKPIAYLDKATGKPASFISAWLLDASPVVEAVKTKAAA